MCKKTLLKAVYFLTDLTDEEINSDRLTLGLTNDIEVEKDIRIDEKTYNRKWNTTTSLILNPETMNCGKCANCGCWATDRERENYIVGLDNGARVDGSLLCDECLPRDHRWAF